MGGISGLVLPGYGAESLISVLSKVPQYQAKRTVIVLCDGLGWHNLEARKAHAPFLRARLPQMKVLTTTFPSTTAAALPTFGTGQPPGQTGFVGYTVRRPDDGALINLVPWTEVKDPAIIATPVGNSKSPPFSAKPNVFQPYRSVFTELSDAGVLVTSVGGAKFAGSGLSLAAFGKTNYSVAEYPKDRIDATIRQLKRARQPQLVYLYWGDLDKVGHREGPESPNWAGALTDFDAAFARLIREAPPDTQIILTADHGQITVDPAQQIDVAFTPELSRGVALAAGEARAVHVYLEPESDPSFAMGLTPSAADGERVSVAAERWQNYLGDRAQVWTRGEAVDLGLFGPVRTAVEPWIGDLVVAAKGQTTIVDSRTQTSHSLTLKGVHGSLTPQEMQIPLLAIVT